MPPEDRKIDGKFSVIKRLGGGLSGEVYLVRNEAGDFLALKQLKPVQRGLTRREVLERFRQEFSFLKELNHPGIARMHDYGRDRESGRHYFTTDYIDGGDFLSATKGKPFDSIETLFVETLRALEYLHAREIFHLDIKASNVLIDSKGAVKLIDFGLASRHPETKAGTPTYMAPEILYGYVPDGRADLYSVAVLMYSALAGFNPFQATTVEETLKRQRELDPAPLSSISKNVPSYVDSLLAKMLRKKPSERYLKASHVIVDLNLVSGKKYPLETGETLLGYLPGDGVLIGREAPLKRAEEMITQAKRDPSVRLRQALWIRGDNGSGKSRLLRELKYNCQLSEIEVSLVGSKDGLQSPCGPAVYLLDDVDLWDTSHLETWLEIVSHDGSYPLLTFFSSKPVAQSPLHAFHPLMSPHGVTAFDLENFSRDEVGRYITTVTGLSAPPPTLVDEIHRRSGGIPLFVSEILRSLIQSGRLFDDHGRWSRQTYEDIAVDFTGLNLPDILKKELKKVYARLDSSLQNLVMRLALRAKPVPFNTAPSLFRAIQSGLIKRVNDLVVLENPLWSEILPELVDSSELAVLHDEMAEKGRQEGKKWDEIEILYHLSRGTNDRKAMKASLELAALETIRGNSRNAVIAYEYLLNRFPNLPMGDREEILSKLAQNILPCGPRSKVLEINVKAAEISSELVPSSDLRHPANLERIGSTFLRLGEIQKGRILFEQGRNGALQRQDNGNQMIFENALAQCDVQEGLFDRALAVFGKNYDRWKTWPVEMRKQVTNNDLGSVLLVRGEIEKTWDHLNEYLPFTKRFSHAGPRIRTLYNLGEAARLLKKPEQSGGFYRDCIHEAKEKKMSDLLFRAYNGMGALAHEEHQTEVAIEYYLRALSLARHLNEAASEAALYHNLGLLYEEKKDWVAAEHHFQGAVNILQTLPHPSAIELTYLARTYLELGSLSRLLLRPDQADRYFSLTQKQIEENPHLKILRPILDEERKKETPATVGRLPEGDSPSQKGWEAVIKIIRYLNTMDDIDFLLRAILHFALELSRAERALILMRRPEGDFEIRSSEAQIDDAWKAFSTQIARKVVAEGVAFFTEDAPADHRLSSVESVQALSLSSILALPIISSQKTVGVLYLDARTRRSFLDDPGSLLVFQAFADQVGLALEKARLLQEARQAQERGSRQLEQTQTALQAAQTLIFEHSLHLKKQVEFGNIVAVSKGMHEIFRLMRQVADTPLTVMILGETGTGKELIARAIHFHSGRKEREFVSINCGGLPRDLMESELFGHKAGAFTGANQDKIGLVEAADGGTLFLDEIGEMPPELQVKLLRFLQEREFRRVGETVTRKVDIRIVCATHQDLKEKIRQGHFREDLSFRLHQIVLTLPPLRERKEDIAPLIHHFLKRYGEETAQKRRYRVESAMMRHLLLYDWPGNARELENVVRVAAALSEDGTINLSCLPPDHPLRQHHQVASRGPVTSTIQLDERNRFHPSLTWKDYKNLFVAKAYQHHHFRILATARAVGISPPTVYRFVRDLKLEDTDNRLYQFRFDYQAGLHLRDFQKSVFASALKHFKKPYQALRALGVSQGQFYKIIRGQTLLQS